MRRPTLRYVLCSVALVVSVLCTQLGCALAPSPMVHISGTVFGESLAGAGPGPSGAAAAIAATVTCNHTTAQTHGDGTYSLALAAADAYDCMAAAPPSYVPVSATVPSSNGQAIVLNFGPSPLGSCGWTAGASVLECSALRLRPGDLSGTIAYADSHAPAAGVSVHCWVPPASPTPGVTAPTGFTVTTDGAGRYTLASLHPGAYLCVGEHDVSLHTARVAPVTGGTLNFAICRSACPLVTYHQGPVMHTFTAYLIFWLPRPYIYDGTGSPATFESLMAQYFQDVGGTPFYNVVTQYWDYAGPMQNSVSLGGTYVDTRPYGHAATTADPLASHDLKDEVQRAIATNHWTADLNHAFFVFTGFGAQICTDLDHKSCSFVVGVGTFCGYHDYLPGSAPTIYAVIPDSAVCVGYPDASPFAGPNHDRMADWVIDTVSHEHFEAATDPDQLGWYSDNGYEGEIGDLCVASFGSVRGDGSNVTLNHGHSYLIQGEWSGRANGCAFSL